MRQYPNGVIPGIVTRISYLFRRCFMKMVFEAKLARRRRQPLQIEPIKVYKATKTFFRIHLLNRHDYCVPDKEI